MVLPDNFSPPIILVGQGEHVEVAREVIPNLIDLVGAGKPLIKLALVEAGGLAIAIILRVAAVEGEEMEVMVEVVGAEVIRVVAETLVIRVLQPTLLQ
jgi:hypothetical protein